MYSDVIRSDEYRQQLLDFIRQEYEIEGIGISSTKRGFYGETWKLSTTDDSYFIKTVYSAVHKPVYENSFPVIDRLNCYEIDFVSKIVKTSRGQLSTHFDGAVLGVFDWIEGENRQDDDTKIREYRMLAKVYTVPTAGLCIPKEDFSARSAEIFFAQWESLSSDLPICTLFERHRDRIEDRAKRLRLFSQRCKNDRSSFFITHGDAGGNYIVSKEKDYLVDWDNPMLAPPERDAWFCMQWDWARKAFHETLRQNGIDYSLRPERLAYYCYHMFFFYLNAYLDRFTHTGITQGVEEYMDCWIEESFQFADTIQ